MSATELQALLGPHGTSTTPKKASALLSLLRDSAVPHPKLVLRHGETALLHHHPTTRMHWEITEQIVQAAHLVGNSEAATKHLTRIQRRFPHSIRTAALVGQDHEVASRWKEASQIYLHALKEHPMAPSIYQRQIAMLKTARRTIEAIALLSHYLNTYAQDVSAWTELCALCLAEGRFSHALFAANEVLMNDGENFAAHILVADVYMTVGGKDEVVLGRAHYASSLNVKKQGNLRALYGLWLACSILQDGQLLEGAEESQNRQLLTLAQNGIAAIYVNPNSRSGGPFVSETLCRNIMTGKKRT